MDYSGPPMPFQQDMAFSYNPSGYMPQWGMFSQECHPCMPVLPTTPNVNQEERSKDYKPVLSKSERALKFASVNGRMCLLSGSKKYDITVGEMSRRARLPEDMNTSLLNAILRNGKAKSNGDKLRARLTEFNILVASGKRKNGQTKTSSFTALCEGEAGQMASDVRDLLLGHGGVSEISDFFHKTDLDLGADLLANVAILKKWITRIISIHPEYADPDEIVSQNECDRAVNHLSLVTHGFSHKAIPIVLRFAINILDTMSLLHNQSTGTLSDQATFGTPPESPKISVTNKMTAVHNPYMSNVQATSNPTPALPDLSPSSQNAKLPGEFSNMHQWSPEMVHQWQQNMIANYQQSTAGFHRSTSEQAPYLQRPVITPQAPDRSKDYRPILSNAEERLQIIDKSSGRLLLLGECTKYPVSLGEVCRRISAPESLHNSLINALLRNAKAKDNNNRLQSKLLNYNVELPKGRKKEVCPTIFTALCEAEARKLAMDFRQLLLTDYHSGHEEIGNFLADTDVATKKEQINREAEIVRTWLQKMIDIHPREAYPDEINPKNDAERAVHHLSLITHGFSHIAIPAVLEFAMRVMETVGKRASPNSVIENTPQSTPQPHYPMNPMMAMMSMYPQFNAMSQQMPPTAPTPHYPIMPTMPMFQPPGTN